ncbi:hypothetical protein [Streptomyces fuscichromogenes]|uniref:Uncharacterized protein n=1 Tax=Streptomyces fuscichromogenes TaxID=1324013 RepID=A0A918CXN6_9ACTN|nr:hypothetical protein [Streptomyces fuscichromogenes]GGN45269.1 hypothetical protein GCM10011578_097050 [Streptomyces fuscichromogenes]
MRARLDSLTPQAEAGIADAFSRALDAVRFPGAEAAERARRERAVTVRAGLAYAETRRRQDHLHRLARDGAEPGERAAALRSLADLREESAERYDELAVLEPDHAEAHRTAAAQARDHAAHDREFAALLARQDTPAPHRDPDHTASRRFIAGGAASRDREVKHPLPQGAARP